MAQELRTVTVNMKSFDQDIPDPIVAGGGDADGRTLRVVFSQEAEAQLTDDSKVYLSWCHQGLKVKGYNVFDLTSKTDPVVWEIRWPQKMLREGDVLCCIELVDDISVVQSQNFTVHVLSDPNDGSEYVASDDFSVFQQAVVDMNSAVSNAGAQLAEQEERFSEMEASFQEMGSTISGFEAKLAAIETALAAKFDTDKVGIDFDDDIKTIKDYIDRDAS